MRKNKDPAKTAAKKTIQNLKITTIYKLMTYKQLIITVMLNLVT